MKIFPLTIADIHAIHTWPSYPEEYKVFNHAIGETGWLAQFPPSELNHCYGAWLNFELIGFSILVQTAIDDAEFYIALKPDKLGMNLGKAVTLQTIEMGFKSLALKKIHLKVRIWHHRAIHLYKQAGFTKGDEVSLEINGSMVRFLNMELNHSQWESMAC